MNQSGVGQLTELVLKEGNVEMAEWLIEKGAETSIVSTSYRRQSHALSAAVLGRADLVDLFLSHASTPTPLIVLGGPPPWRQRSGPVVRIRNSTSGEQMLASLDAYGVNAPAISPTTANSSGFWTVTGTRSQRSSLRKPSAYQEYCHPDRDLTPMHEDVARSPFHHLCSWVVGFWTVMSTW